MQTAEPAKEEKTATADEDSFEMMNDKDDTTTPKEDVAKDSKTEDAPVVKEKKVVEEKKAPSLKKSPPDSKVGNEKKVRDVNQKKKICTVFGEFDCTLIQPPGYYLTTIFFFFFSSFY